MPIRSPSVSRWNSSSAPGDIGADVGVAEASSPRTLESAARLGRSAPRAPEPSRTTLASSRSRRRSSGAAWCAKPISGTCEQMPAHAATPAETCSRGCCAAGAARYYELRATPIRPAGPPSRMGRPFGPPVTRQRDSGLHQGGGGGPRVAPDSRVASARMHNVAFRRRSAFPWPEIDTLRKLPVPSVGTPDMRMFPRTMAGPTFAAGAFDSTAYPRASLW